MEILGGGRTSRLYRELVENGIAVMTYAYSMEMEAPGMVVGLGLAAPGVTLDEVKKAALAVTDKFLKEGPTARGTRPRQEADRGLGDLRTRQPDAAWPTGMARS